MLTVKTKRTQNKTYTGCNKSLWECCVTLIQVQASKREHTKSLSPSVSHTHTHTHTHTHFSNCHFWKKVYLQTFPLPLLQSLPLSLYRCVCVCVCVCVC